MDPGLCYPEIRQQQADDGFCTVLSDWTCPRVIAGEGHSGETSSSGRQLSSASRNAREGDPGGTSGVAIRCLERAAELIGGSFFDTVREDAATSL
jgi:hypothetical protein